jgi:uncharacterized metal-binding protein
MQEMDMDAYTPDFSVDVQGVKGFCAAGERYAKEQMTKGSVPVLSCEGPCIRGEIARLAANFVARDGATLARACHAETFFVPHSAMAEWVKTADKILMIDGCFLKCHGRVLKNVPEEERRATARQVADNIIAKLSEDASLRRAAA